MLSRMIRSILTTVVVLASWHAGAALAESDSRVLFQHKRWEVRVVAFDDGEISCVAQVSTQGSSFAIWANGTDPVKLQFFSEDWNLGSGNADVRVRIDRRQRWDLHNADLVENSVLFDLPSDNDGTRFLNEVMRGNRVVLSNSNGVQVGVWSLSGSSASIRALISCVDLLEHDLDDNPFE